MVRLRRIAREVARRSALRIFGTTSARRDPSYRETIPARTLQFDDPFFAQEEYKWPKRVIETPLPGGVFDLAAVGVSRLDRAVLTSDGRVFDRRGRLVRESLVTHDYQAIHPGPLRRRVDVDVDGSVLPLNWWSGADNVYHWLRDVLPRAIVATRTPEPITIVAPPRLLGFHETAIEGLRRLVEVRSVVQLEPGQRLRAETMLQPCLPPYIRGCGALHPETAGFIREVNGLTGRVEPATSESEISCVLVARGRTSHRRVDGEARLAEQLRDRAECVVIEPQFLEWSEQVSLASRARVIVGVYGAGLTHMVFGRGGGCVEIHNSDSIETHFSTLSRSISIPYARVEGGPGDPREDFGIDEEAVDLVCRHVERMLIDST